MLLNLKMLKFKVKFSRFYSQKCMISLKGEGDLQRKSQNKCKIKTFDIWVLINDVFRKIKRICY